MPIAEAIASTPDMEKSCRFLNRAFKWSYKGELYENSPGNVNDFYASLRSFLLKSRIIANNEHVLEGLSRVSFREAAK
jgi:hypothetical protein